MLSQIKKYLGIVEKPQLMHEFWIAGTETTDGHEVFVCARYKSEVTKGLKKIEPNVKVNPDIYQQVCMVEKQFVTKKEVNNAESE